MKKIYCVGLKDYMYVGSVPGESAFDEEPGDCNKTILCCVIPSEREFYSDEKIEIELEEIYTWCGSGYTTASYGEVISYTVNDFGPLTHIPKDHKPIELIGAMWDGEHVIYDEEFDTNGCELYDCEIKTNIFECSYDGGDSYYPMGGTYVNYDLFMKLPRTFNTRPIWVLYGASGSGKSTIAHNLRSDQIVYETDSANNGKLPDEIWADIIVVGNKWKEITYEKVLEHLPSDCEVISVQFNKSANSTTPIIEPVNEQKGEEL